MPITFLKWINTPPESEDATTNEMAVSLLTMIRASLVTATILLTLAMILVPDHLLRWIVLMIVWQIFGIACLLISKLGHTRSAALMMLFVFGALITLAAFTANGIRSPGMYVFMTMPLSAGLLFDFRSSVISAVIIFLVGVALTVSEAYGWVSAETIRFSPLTYLSNMGLTLILLVWVYFVATNRIRRSLDRAQQEIEKRNEAEVELRELNQTLEQRIASRTLQLEIANKELESFSYAVSHDLRAPLRAINGFSKVLIDDYYENLDEDAKNYLTRIHEASIRMSDLIADLLTLSRASSGDLSIFNTDMTMMALDIVDELVRSEPSRQVTVVIAPQMHVNADRGLLHVVLTNLLNNAWKYSAKNGNARISLGPVTDSTRFPNITQTIYCVEDNGAGFDMKKADKLFNPFHRLHSTSDFSGTGIGLATVLRIIRRHGGHIWAEAEVDKGARFYFSFPDARV